MRSRVGALLVSLALTGCAAEEAETGWGGSIETLPNGARHVSNPANGRWDEDEVWSLEEDLRLGGVTGDGPEVFGRIRDVTVDADGNVYVLDSQATEVRIFDAQGRHRTTYGRRGQGPGELTRPGALHPGPEGTVWIIDTGNQRYVVIDADGRVIDERRRFAGGQISPWPGVILSDGRVIDAELSFEDGTARRINVLFSPTGEVLDTVTVPERVGPVFRHSTGSGMVVVDVPFSAQLISAWDPRGSLWVGVPDRYRIVRTDLGGDTTLVIDRAYDPIPVNASEKDAAVAAMEWFTRQGGRVDPGRIPDEHPAYSRLIVDTEGYLWVRATTARTGEVTRETLDLPRAPAFDVFAPDGIYLGRVGTDVPLIRVKVFGRHLVGLTLDDFGVNYLVRFVIQGRAPGSD